MNRFIKFFCIIMLFFIAVISVTPTILSIHAIQRNLLAWYNQYSQEKIHIDSIAIGWFSGIAINNFSYTDSHDKPLINIEAVEVSSPIRSILQPNSHPLKMHIFHPTVAIHASEDQKIQKADKEARTFPLILLPYIDVTIVDGTFYIKDDLALSNIQFTCRLTSLHQVMIDLSCQTRDREQHGFVNIQAKAESLKELLRLYKNKPRKDLASTPRARIQAHIEKFPTTLLAYFLPSSTIQHCLPQLIGSTMSCRMEHVFENMQMHTQLELTSIYCTLAAGVASEKGQMFITKPLRAEIKITPAAFEKFATAEKIPYRLQQETMFVFSSHNMTHKRWPKNTLPIDVQISQTNPLSIINEKNQTLVSNIAIDCTSTNLFASDCRIQIQGKSSCSADIASIKADISYNFLKYRLHAWSLDAQGSIIRIVQFFSDNISSIGQKLGPQLQLVSTGTVDTKDNKKMTAALQAKMTLQDKDLQRMFGSHISIDMSCIPQLSDQSMTLDNFVLQINNEKTICQLTGSGQYDNRQKNLYIQGSVFSPIQRENSYIAKFSNHIQLPSHSRKFSIETSGSLQKLPLTWLQNLFQNQSSISLLGNTLDATWQCLFQEKKKDNFCSLSLQTENIQAKLHLTEAPSTRIPLECTFILPKPLLTNIMQKKSSFVPTNDLKGNIKITKFDASLSHIYETLIQDSSVEKLVSKKLFVGSASSELIEFKQDTTLHQIPPIAFEFSSNPSSQIVDVKIKSEGSKKEEKLMVTLLGKHIWDDHTFSLVNATFDIKGLMNNIPIAPIIAVFQPDYGKKIDVLLGSSMRCQFNAHVEQLNSGTMDMKITSTTLSTQAKVYLQKGILYLQDSIFAEFTCPPHAGKVLFKDINPLLATVKTGQNPIQICIDKKGFQVPIQKFDSKKIQIGTAKITFGKMTVRNKGTIRAILQFLENNRSTRGKNISIWFTPIYLHMQNGVIFCERADILLADTFHIATWGTVNVGNDQLNMILALPSETVKQAFKIEKLDPNYVLQLAITGSTSNPALDTTAATAKIGALTIKKSKSKKAQILGELLQAVTSVNSGEQSIPPPTTTPFPWEKKNKK